MPFLKTSFESEAPILTCQSHIILAVKVCGENDGKDVCSVCLV